MSYINIISCWEPKWRLLLLKDDNFNLKSTVFAWNLSACTTVPPLSGLLIPGVRLVALLFSIFRGCFCLEFACTTYCLAFFWAVPASLFREIRNFAKQGAVFREIRNSFRTKFSRILYERNSSINPTTTSISYLATTSSAAFPHGAPTSVSYPVGHFFTSLDRIRIHEEIAQKL